MRYWGWLAAKLAVSGLLLGGIWFGVTLLLPRPHLYHGQFLGFDLPWTLAAGLVFLICCGLIYLSILDQRYRCRVCARRLRMPVTSGSWGQMLQLGRPHIEYICPYGHGTLKVAELQISGLEPAEWTRHGGMWEELDAADKEDAHHS
jgi:hypothetical protein